VRISVQAAPQCLPGTLIIAPTQIAIQGAWGVIDPRRHVAQWNGPVVLLPRRRLKLARGAKDKEHVHG